MEKRKMIVLGAGASIGSKRFPINSSFSQLRTRMPSAENFFYDLFKMNKTERREASYLNFLGLTFEGINDLITRAWNINQSGFNPEEWKGINIEDVMTFFETGSKMYMDGSEEQKACEKIQEQLLVFMNPLIPTICEDQHCEYLQEVFLSLDENDTIVSYNWDTIAEFTLERLNMKQLKNYARLMRESTIIPEEYRNTGLILKLHGSFNWMICLNKDCEKYNKVQPPFQKNRYKLLSFHDSWKCQYCGDTHLKYYIVPPVSNKLIHKNSLLKNQWLIAREKLLDVNELIFIGYSFPPTDFYAEWLFRQIYFIDGKPNIEITIVNPDYGKKYSQVTKRYNQIFHGFKINTFKTLKEYACFLGY